MSSNPRLPRLPRDYKMVALDETVYWNLPAEMMKHILRIETVYLYDASTVTHLCEITPSYCLETVETRAVFSDPDVSDETREEIDNVILGNTDYDPTYMHAADIDRMVARWKAEGAEFRFADLGDCHELAPDRDDFPEGEDGDEPYERAFMEAVREYVSGNAQL